MKHLWTIVVISALALSVLAQEPGKSSRKETSLTLQESSQTPSDKPKLAKHQATLIAEQQKKIDRLTDELTHEQEKLEVLKKQKADTTSGNTTEPKPQIAHLINSTSGTFVGIDHGKDGFRPGDRVVFVRRTEAGAVVLGNGYITEVVGRDGLAVVSQKFKYFFYEDVEVYVCSRANSPFSLYRADFKTNSVGK
jgi:hypothetical protein